MLQKSDGMARWPRISAGPFPFVEFVLFVVDLRLGSQWGNLRGTLAEEKSQAMEIIHREESYAIMGACFEVYNEKGPGFLEPVYQECLEIESRGIPFRAKQPLTLTYKERVLKKTYEPDFTCFEKVIVEIKAVSQLIDDHRAEGA